MKISIEQETKAYNDHAICNYQLLADLLMQKHKKMKNAETEGFLM